MNDDAETWTVPVVDPETGDGWDVEVEAESAREAMRRVDPGLHIASTFADEHLGVTVDGADSGGPS
jgi:ribose 5-phosphate isomerase